MQNPFLIGPRLYLRPIELDDIPRVTGWLNHPEVRRHLARRDPLNRVQEEAYIRGLGGGPQCTLVIVLQEGDRPIGVVGLHGVQPVARVGDVGICVGEQAEWDKGYGREALGLLLEHCFDTLNLHKVELTVYADNLRGLACYRRLGFEEEGRRREAHFTGGRYVDIVLMGVLAREWRAAREA